MRAFKFVPLVLLGGCIWTQFDELRDDVWVDSVSAIEGSSKYGEAVMEATAGPTTAGGTTIGVLGRNTASVSFLTYTPDGTRTITKMDLSSSFMLVNTFDENPVYAADPASDQIAIAALTGALTEQPALRGLKLGLYHGATLQGVNPGFEPPATFPENTMKHETPTAMGFGTTSEVMVGRKGQLLHVALNGTPGLWTGCLLPDANETAYAIAYGDVDGAAGAEWIIASAPAGIDAAPDPGRVWIFPAGAEPTDPTGATDPCPTPSKEVVSGGVGMPFGAGTQIQIADFGAGPRVLISSPGAGGKISVIDFAAPVAELTQINTPGVADLDSFVVADVAEGNPGLELVIGAPLADDAGSTRAGAVRILKPDGTQAAEPLFDADAETEQHFGKTVAVVPYGDRRIIVAGSEGEVFTYFRTTFYAEVRSGR